jgi:predicted nucleic acid-binding protein
MLFDASAIMNLFRNDQSVTLLRGHTIDLAFYEVGNAIRRKVSVEKVLTIEEGTLALDSLTGVMTAMGLIKRANSRTVLETAHTGNLTFYDASYLCAAETAKEELVTDDKHLFEVAKKRTKVLKSADLPRLHPELLRSATASKGASSEELQKMLREGRAEDKRHEEALERRYLERSQRSEE